MTVEVPRHIVGRFVVTEINIKTVVNQIFLMKNYNPRPIGGLD